MKDVYDFHANMNTIAKQISMSVRNIFIITLYRDIVMLMGNRLSLIIFLIKLIVAFQFVAFNIVIPINYSIIISTVVAIYCVKTFLSVYNGLIILTVISTAIVVKLINQRMFNFVKNPYQSAQGALIILIVFSFTGGLGLFGIHILMQYSLAIYHTICNSFNVNLIQLISNKFYKPKRLVTGSSKMTYRQATLKTNIIHNLKNQIN